MLPFGRRVLVFAPSPPPARVCIARKVSSRVHGLCARCANAGRRALPARDAAGSATHLVTATARGITAARVCSTSGRSTRPIVRATERYGWPMRRLYPRRANATLTPPAAAIASSTRLPSRRPRHRLRSTWKPARRRPRAACASAWRRSSPYPRRDAHAAPRAASAAPSSLGVRPPAVCSPPCSPTSAASPRSAYSGSPAPSAAMGMVATAASRPAAHAASTGRRRATAPALSSFVHRRRYSLPRRLTSSVWWRPE